MFYILGLIVLFLIHALFEEVEGRARDEKEKLEQLLEKGKKGERSYAGHNRT